MELIKTDNPEYQELLKMKEEEKFETFTTLAHTQPGEVVVSALCKEGIAMVYLGTWYTKNVHRDHSWGYGSSDVDKFYLTLNSPQRAFFIVDSEDLTSEEDEIMKQIKQDNIERLPNEDWNVFYDRQDVVRKKYWAEQKVKKAELIAAGGERFKIISYPISSKRVKKLVETKVFNDKFTDLEYNKELILNVSARRDGDHYGKRGEQQQLAELGHEYPRVPMKDFLITNAYYTLSDVDYMTDDKNDINRKAYNFINAHFRCRLQPKLYKGGHRNGEYIDFDF
jgi:hypothetical protein